MDDKPAATELELQAGKAEPGLPDRPTLAYVCDRCGAPMTERNCKIICHNCGHQFDCSDLSIYFD